MQGKRVPLLNIVILLMILGAAFLGMRLWFAHSSGEREKADVRLISAVKVGDVRYIKSLLDQGADPSAADNNGATALMWAAVHGRVDCISLLISRGAKVNTKDHYGATALMEAAASGGTDGVRLLLNKGAAIGDADNTGKTARTWAKQSGKFQIIEVLNQEIAARKLAREQTTRRYVAADAEVQSTPDSSYRDPAPPRNVRTATRKRIFDEPAHGTAKAKKKKIHHHHPQEIVVARTEPVSKPSPIETPSPPPSTPSIAAPSTLPTRPPAPWEHP